MGDTGRGDGGLRDSFLEGATKKSEKKNENTHGGPRWRAIDRETRTETVRIGLSVVSSKIFPWLSLSEEYILNDLDRYVYL